MMPQSYTILPDSFNDVNIAELYEYTKKYSQVQLTTYLKSEFGAGFTLIATQLELHEKAKNKLPEWVDKGCLFTSRSLEQCSSPAMARFKAGLVSGGVLLDLSAGLGVDDVAFSAVFQTVYSIDPDENLNAIVRYNFNRLSIRNISRFNATAEIFIENYEGQADVIYIDADRRPAGKERNFTLSGSQPDVIKLMPLLGEKCRLMMLKLSPMTDLTYLLRTLHHIKSVYVAGIKGEVKEVLVLLDPAAKSSDARIVAVRVGDSGRAEEQFAAGDVLDQAKSQDNMEYFYEPSNMIIKAGLSSAYAEALGLHMPATASQYMWGAKVQGGYFGRVFRIHHHGEFSKSQFNAYLKSHQITKANISVRNFVTGVDELRKTFSLADGGDHYFFFTQDRTKNKLFWHCMKD